MIAFSLPLLIIVVITIICIVLAIVLFRKNKIRNDKTTNLKRIFGIILIVLGLFVLLELMFALGNH